MQRLELGNRLAIAETFDLAGLHLGLQAEFVAQASVAEWRAVADGLQRAGNWIDAGLIDALLRRRKPAELVRVTVDTASWGMLAAARRERKEAAA